MDKEKLQTTFLAPGELKEIFLRALRSNITCACKNKNCYQLVVELPEKILDDDGYAAVAVSGATNYSDYSRYQLLDRYE